MNEQESKRKLIEYITQPYIDMAEGELKAQLERDKDELKHLLDELIEILRQGLNAQTEEEALSVNREIERKIVQLRLIQQGLRMPLEDLPRIDFPFWEKW